MMQKQSHLNISFLSTSLKFAYVQGILATSEWKPHSSLTQIYQIIHKFPYHQHENWIRNLYGYEKPYFFLKYEKKIKINPKTNYYQLCGISSCAFRDILYQLWKQAANGQSLLWLIKYIRNYFEWKSITYSGCEVTVIAINKTQRTNFAGFLVQ